MSLRPWLQSMATWVTSAQSITSVSLRKAHLGSARTELDRLRQVKSRVILAMMATFAPMVVLGLCARPTTTVMVTQTTLLANSAIMVFTVKPE